MHRERRQGRRFLRLLHGNVTAARHLADNTIMQAKPPFTDVPGALEEFKAGRKIVVVDDEDRENEGDLTLAAEFVTPEAINFMSKYGRGLICLSLTEERADYLRLGPMTQQNSSRFGTAFTESIEARDGGRSGTAGARLSSARPARRGPSARRANGGFRRPGAHGWTDSGGRDLRDHER
jgi:3,4-dihydroxy-2-butanone 4-phosphate synthase